MRLLMLCHGYPGLGPSGGTEAFAHGLFRALRDDGAVDGLFLAGAAAHSREGKPGTALQAAPGGAADEMLLWTGGFDSFFLSQTDLHGVAPELASVLRDLRPDVVHVHHLLLLGAEALHLIRRTLPRARIVMTLHDYYAICAHDGQMSRSDGRLCHAASPDACHACLPERGPTDFRLREMHLRAMLDQVDLFVSPSEFLRRRFVAWGLPESRIVVVRNGIPAAPAAPARDVPAEGRRDRFGFLGHVNRFKGATLALEASALLSAAGEAHGLELHGGTAFQNEAFLARFEALLAAAPAARHHGSYAPADQAAIVAGLDWVLVPSLWWENAPLVIQEAFRHRRPVICADVGGMAEAVRDGVDGLHFRAGDARSLADTMRRAATTPGLWEQLAANIAAPRTVSDSAAEHLALYRDLLATRPVAASRRKAA